MPRWVTVGEFGAPHGVKGAIRLRSFTEEPEAVFGLDGLVLGGDGKAPVRLRKLRFEKGLFIVAVEGCSSREAAAQLAGREVRAPRESLAKADTARDEFYAADLVGLEVRDPAGKRLGTVESVDEYGAGPVIEVLLDTRMDNVGRHALVPFRRALVPDVNIAGGFITVDWDDWFGSEEVVPAGGEEDEDKDKA